MKGSPTITILSLSGFAYSLLRMLNSYEDDSFPWKWVGGVILFGFLSIYQFIWIAKKAKHHKDPQ